jgi:hypothetical protein
MTLIDTAMAAAMLGCSVRHIRNLIDRGTLTNHGTERRALLSLDAITDAVQSGQIQPRPKRGRKGKERTR